MKELRIRDCLGTPFSIASFIPVLRGLRRLIEIELSASKTIIYSVFRILSHLPRFRDAFLVESPNSVEDVQHTLVSDLVDGGSIGLETLRLEDTSPTTIIPLL